MISLREQLLAQKAKLEAITKGAITPPALHTEKAIEHEGGKGALDMSDLCYGKTITEFKQTARSILLHDPSTIHEIITRARESFGKDEGFKALNATLLELRENLAHFPDRKHDLINQALRRAHADAWQETNKGKKGGRR